jgi:prophage regulatory protein
MNGEHKTGGAAAPEGTAKLERMADLETRVGLKKSQLWKLIRERRFPAPIKCGRSSLFVSAEVDSWIAERIRESRGG